jgi:alanine dehydrogenase
MSVQAGAHALEKTQGGRGILLGGVAGVAPGHVVVLGGGVVGSNAIRMAVGLEAEVTVLDKSLNRLRELDIQYSSAIHTIYATQDAIHRYVPRADLVIGAVLVPGGFAPKLVSKAMLSEMKHGAVLVDVAIDQGGCFETSIPTTHTEPTYTVDGIVHYCVTNMPGGVPRTSSFALNNATLPYIVDLANKGYKRALLEDVHLRNGLNVHKGKITHSAVAAALGLKCFSPLEVLNV